MRVYQYLELTKKQNEGTLQRRHAEMEILRCNKPYFEAAKRTSGMSIVSTEVFSSLQMEHRLIS
jgi:hypothetical protein